jgi:hypothetical protein
VLAAGPGAVVGFETAAVLHGWDLLKDPEVAQLIVAPSVHLGPSLGAVRIYRSALAESEVMLRGVLPLTTPARTALDIAASRSTDQSVVVLDSALRSGTVNERLLSAYFHSTRRHGVRLARAALQLTDPASGSVAESEARLLFTHCGLPPPVTQFPVFLDGVLIARLDFAWPWAMLAGEIDGFAYHSRRGDFQRDRTRQNAVVQAGWRVLRFTVDDVRRREPYVVAQIRQALDDSMHSQFADSLPATAAFHARHAGE